jgi:acetyl-CoA carboxylase biotin carboxyl carrier protein
VGLSHEDVQEILRLIDDSEVAELRLEIEGLSLYVRRGGAGEPEPLSEPGPPSAAEREVTPAAEPADGLFTVTAPMIGTFYRAEAPGAAPFVEVGARVEESSVVCLIEVMKMMNSIPAGVAGTVVEVCVENAQAVEFGTPLFRVRPDR